MDKAKAKIGNFLSKDGKHETTVHETINPAVQNEHVTRTQHNEQTKAVDREVHQDHHHTSVQPIQDREVLPEQHSHQMAGIEHRNITHGTDEHAKSRLAAEQAQFKNTREVGETQRTNAQGETIAGEHVHHHVHENIQPIIQKETIQPSVVHTTVPVHEVHQNEAKHHTASQLPPVSMSEFQSQGGHLGGREERTDAFAGEPRSVGGTLGGQGAHGTTSLTEADGSRTGTGHHHGSSTGHHGSTGTGSAVGNNGTSIGNNGSSGNYATGNSGLTGSSTGHNGTSVGNNGTSTGTHGSSTTTTGKKPGLMDKLNPKKDTDGDGKAGIMD
ncbi:hypothetical protein LARI1_G007928 [Lachnellula arida]|uniref:Allergen n=1 Tax=Lachnellula arida TaxID=1316785 RepID=A0A8T9B5X5_9HELO|nr:hypothetical protein LARI1_G007928 [Lachnellula arida]